MIYEFWDDLYLVRYPTR